MALPKLKQKKYRVDRDPIFTLPDEVLATIAFLRVYIGSSYPCLNCQGGIVTIELLRWLQFSLFECPVNASSLSKHFYSWMSSSLLSDCEPQMDALLIHILRMFRQIQIDSRVKFV
jgi:hypothetical protein